MAKVNRGKQFENEIHKAFMEYGTGCTIDRLKDPGMGMKGVGNICDFVVYHPPYLYYFECKSTNGGTVHFKNVISDTQWEGLIERSYHDGVEAGYLLWFISYDLNVFVPASEMLRLQKMGKKSISYQDIRNNVVEFITIPGRKRKVLYDYFADNFLYKLEREKDIHTRRWIPVE